jgi:hypothetical protein
MAGEFGCTRVPSETSKARPLLYESDWFRVEQDSAFLVRVIRSPVGFVSLLDARRRCLPVLHTLDRLGRRQRSLLFDARDAVGVSDPVYEAWYRSYRVRMAEGFERAAVLVRTQAGQLHSRRLIENDGESGRWAVFQDEALALRYLDGRMPTPRSDRAPTSGFVVAPATIRR